MALGESGAIPIGYFMGFVRERSTTTILIVDAGSGIGILGCEGDFEVGTGMGGGVGDDQILDVEGRVLGIEKPSGEADSNANDNGSDAEEDEEDETARTEGLFGLTRGTVAFGDQGIFRRRNPVDLVFGDLDNIGAGAEKVLGVIVVGGWWNPLLHGHGEMRSGIEGREEGMDYGGLGWLAWGME